MKTTKKSLIFFGYFMAINAYALSISEAQGDAFIGSPLNIHFIVKGVNIQDKFCSNVSVLYGATPINSKYININNKVSSTSLNEMLITLKSDIPVNEPLVYIDLTFGCRETISRKFQLFANPLLVNNLATKSSEKNSQILGEENSRPINSIKLAEQIYTKSYTDKKEKNNLGDNLLSYSLRKDNSGKIEKNQIIKSKVNEKVSVNAASINLENRQSGSKLELQSAADWLDDQNLYLSSSAQLSKIGLNENNERSKSLILDDQSNLKGEELPELSDLKIRGKILSELKGKLLKSELKTNLLKEELQQAINQKFNNWLIWSLSTLLFFGALCLFLILNPKFRRLMVVKVFNVRRSDRKNNPFEKQNLPGGNIHDSLSKDYIQDSDDKESLENSDSLLPILDRTRSAEPILEDNLVSECSLDYKDLSQAPNFAGSSILEPILMSYQSKATDRTIELVQFENLEHHSARQIRQQADFYVSIGQNERAVSMLTQALDTHPMTDPNIYLDLLSIFQTLGATNSYEDTRLAFSKYFNGIIPSLTDFKNTSLALEDYSTLIVKISEIWPTSQAIDFLQELIFRDEKSPDQIQLLELTAFREILLLKEIYLDIFNSLSGSNASGDNYLDFYVEKNEENKRFDAKDEISENNLLFNSKNSYKSSSQTRPILVDFELPIELERELNTSQFVKNIHVVAGSTSTSINDKKLIESSEAFGDNSIDFDFINIKKD